MFVTGAISTQLDKAKRYIIKYKTHGKLNVKPIKWLLAVLCTLGCLIYMRLLSRSTSPRALATQEEIVFSHRVTELYETLIHRIKLSKNNPEQTTTDKLSIPQNPSFERTKTVQLLFDYIQAATKELRQQTTKLKDRHVECDYGWTSYTFLDMDHMQQSVNTFVNIDQGLYSSVIKKYATPVQATKENSKGLDMLIGQNCLTAKRLIAKGTCIGHYYGDEYLMEEYDYTFPPKKTGRQLNREYLMSVSMNDMLDERLNLADLDIEVATDGLHDWSKGSLKQGYEPFLNDARGTLGAKRMFVRDRLRQNTDFVYCAVDGVWKTFVVAIRDIEEGEQLFVNYGVYY